MTCCPDFMKHASEDCPVGDTPFDRGYGTRPPMTDLSTRGIAHLRATRGRKPPQGAPMTDDATLRALAHECAILRQQVPVGPPTLVALLDRIAALEELAEAARSWRLVDEPLAARTIFTKEEAALRAALDKLESTR